MGKAGGVCGGRGGSQHLHYRNFYSNGVQGGIVPVATGMALAEKLKQTGGVAVVFLGDGTLGEGVVYEAFNIAAAVAAADRVRHRTQRLRAEHAVGVADRRRGGRAAPGIRHVHHRVRGRC